MSTEQMLKFDENEIKSRLPDANFRNNGNLGLALYDLTALLEHLIDLISLLK